jgi:23S rRNA pseudouridine1911/1915/1917 synthase
MKIKVLYEDANILAIDKPSGILAHSDKTATTETVLDWAKAKYPKAELVHRLDKETSGVMLVAKNSKTHEFLKKQFSAPALEITNRGLADRQNRINKVYVAIVNGFVKNDRGVINKSIGRSPRDFRRRLAGRGARGPLREAVTEYKVLERLSIGKKKFTYLEIKPKTGRTHQIRVHMKFLNHPVVCDSLYNPGGPCPKGISRLGLHAKSIEFRNLNGKIIKVESPLPKEFKKLI